MDFMANFEQEIANFTNEFIAIENKFKTEFEKYEEMKKEQEQMNELITKQLKDFEENMRKRFGDDVPESLNMTKFHLKKQLEFNKSF